MTTFGEDGAWAAKAKTSDRGLAFAVLKNDEPTWQRGDLAADGSGFTTASPTGGIAMGPRGSVYYGVRYDGVFPGSLLMRDNQVLLSSVTDTLPNGAPFFDLPTQSFGQLIAARTAGFTPMAGGSQGTLCLGASISRMVPPSPSSGNEGRIEVPLDLRALPQPMGTSAALSGETWRFQSGTVIPQWGPRRRT